MDLITKDMMCTFAVQRGTEYERVLLLPLNNATFHCAWQRTLLRKHQHGMEGGGALPWRAGSFFWWRYLLIFFGGLKFLPTVYHQGDVLHC